MGPIWCHFMNPGVHCFKRRHGVLAVAMRGQGVRTESGIHLKKQRGSSPKLLTVQVVVGFKMPTEKQMQASIVAEKREAPPKKEQLLNVN